MLSYHRSNGIEVKIRIEGDLEMGYDTIVIFGHPSNYIARGFKSCKNIISV